VNDAPDLFEPVRAWRVWQAVEQSEQLYLMSPFYRTRWLPREPMQATCRRWRPWDRSRHGAPHESCRCGIYAADLETVVAYVHPCPRRREWPVLGRVLLWGQAIECTDGWRAACAYPEALYVPATLMGDRRDAVRIGMKLERYGVPVELVDRWRPRDLARTLAAA
jgi:hypothetical protein